MPRPKKLNTVHPADLEEEGATKTKTPTTEPLRDDYAPTYSASKTSDTSSPQEEAEDDYEETPAIIKKKSSKKKKKKQKKSKTKKRVVADPPSSSSVEMTTIGASATKTEASPLKIIPDGTYVRIASIDAMRRLPDYRWVEVFGPKAEKVRKDYELWSGFYADVDGNPDDRDRSYCIRNVKRLNPGSIVPDIEAGAWWPQELLSRAGEKPAHLRTSGGGAEDGSGLVRVLTSGNRVGASALFMDIQKLAERALDSNKRECIAFWREILKAEPNVCLRRHPLDQETLCHKLVRLDKRKSLKALLKLKAPMDPRMENAAGKTAIHYACHHRSYKTIAKLVGRCAEERVWVSSPDLVEVAKQYPTLIMPYLETMEFGKEGIDATTRRFPLRSSQSKMRVLGSQVVDHRELWADERNRELERLRSSYAAKLCAAIWTLDFSSQALSSDTTEIPVKARYIACKDIAGAHSSVENSPIGVFLQCGCNDIFTTKVMKAVLDFKWDIFGGVAHRWRCAWYLLYVVAVTANMWEMHSSGDLGTFDDDGWPEDTDGVLTLIFVDIFFIVTTLLLIKTDVVGVYKCGLWNYYTAPNLGYWNVLCTITMIANVFIYCVKKFEGVVEPDDGSDDDGGLTGFKTMNTLSGWVQLLTWVNMIGLLRPFPSTGPFINMISSICVQILPFLALFGMVLWAFGFAFYMSLPRLTSDGDFENNPTGMSFENPGNALGATFVMSVGEIADYISLLATQSYYPDSSLAMVFIFLFVVFLVLLNLLIAIMGEAYNSVISDGVEDDWRFFQCAVICSQEKSSERKNPKHFPAYLHLIEPNIPTFKDKMTDGQEALKEEVDKSLDKLKRFLETDLRKQSALMELRLSKKIEALAAEKRA